MISENETCEQTLAVDFSHKQLTETLLLHSTYSITAFRMEYYCILYSALLHFLKHIQILANINKYPCR